MGNKIHSVNCPWSYIGMTERKRKGKEKNTTGMQKDAKKVPMFLPMHDVKTIPDFDNASVIDKGHF